MTRVIDVRVPDMGNFKDVAVIDVLVKPGDKIEPESPLITLETEKATMDVPSTVGGVVERVAVSKGGKVNAGDVVVAVRAEDGAAEGGSPAEPAGGATPAAGASAPPATTPPKEGTPGTTAPAPGTASAPPSDARTGAPAASPPAAPREPAPQGNGAAEPAQRPVQPAVPALPTAAVPAGSTDASAQAPARQSARAEPSPGAQAAGTQLGGAQPAGARAPEPAAVHEKGFSQAHASPSIRKLARELGVDLAAVTGTGFKGRITQDDVKSFVKRALTGGAGRAGAAAARGGTPAGEMRLPGIPPVDFAQFGPTEVKPLTRIQRISGARLHASWVNLPHVTQFDEADITELEQLRTSLKEKAAARGIKLTPLAFIMRACVKALQQFPQVNASLDPGGENLILKRYVHLGFAADTPNGLLVPVVRDADRKDVYELARAAAELAEKARAGTLGLADMQGGSFTISSLGGIGGTAFTPIINAPEVAILGVSRAQMRPAYIEGAFVPRLMLPLSFSYDHRVIDGALAARFTTFLAQTLADARGLLEAVP